MRKLLLLVCLVLLQTGYTFSQEIITGNLIDVSSKDPLPGATVVVKGIKGGTTTLFDGSFSIKRNGKEAVVLVFSYIGYITQEVEVAGGTNDIGTVNMNVNSVSVNEVVIMGSSIAIDRKTPVALSSVGTQFIQEKASTQEFPELLKNIPGVQATRQGGGFGDSRLSIRGFKSTNVAVIINGMPVNDMENGTVYWSNWAGLTDVTSSMQVQRGLGSSKIAVPSLGGTVNLITKSADAVSGGSVFQGYGSDSYLKTAISVSSGLNDKGWAVTLSGSKAKGDGNADGLQFEAYNYFFNITKVINSKHTLSLTGMGAPQWHGQRSTKNTINGYRNAPQGIRWNSDWGIKDGKVVNVRKNFYHKPIFSLNHYWTINETSSLSTVAYASIGTGGGVNYTGTLPGRTGDAYSPYDLDAVVNTNASSTDGSASTYLRAARNDHKWFGLLSTFKKKINNFNVLGGLDLRSYKGIHFTEVTDLLGADYALDVYKYASSSSNGDINNPYKKAKNGDKVYYNYDSQVNWEGAFLQGEYSKGKLSTFVSLAASNSSYKRTDRYNYLSTDPLRETAFQNFLSYQTKGGLNFNLSEHHNIFVNAGYMTKPPILSNIFLNYRNDINKDAINEKLMSFELGYGFRSSKLFANVNVYHSTYKDRAYQKSIPTDTITYIANLSGVDELHKGIEVDFKYKPIKILTISGSASIGNWEYTKNIGSVNIYSDKQDSIGNISKMYLKGQKVGDEAQTTATLGMDVNIFPDLKIGADYNYYDNYFADFTFSNIAKSGLKPWKIPSYSLLDLNMVYHFKIANLNGTMLFNINNVLDTEYVSDALDNSGLGTASGSTVFYGIGRTYSAGLKINF